MSQLERPASLSSLAKYGFANLSQAMANLDELLALIGDPARPFLATLAKVQDPDQALSATVRIARQDSSSLKKLLRRDESARRLALLAGASISLIEFVETHPSSLSIFDESPVMPKTQDQYQHIFLEALPQEWPDVAEAWRALRIAYRQELLRIAIFDLTSDSVTDVLPLVATALSDIAGAALDAAISIARVELTASKEFGTFTVDELSSTRFAVIAMGKCGARELNYISDVDVIFVAESGSDDLGNSRAIEVATKIATRMMRAIDGVCIEPGLWQVDANLRPEGKSGALVRTLESHVAYYQKWAESWEFQALLKARPVAGDRDLGERYVAELSPMVWQSTERENFVESVQKMRERVTANIPAGELDRQIKLGPGGLRDVEFTVQLLQLVHGRTDETVRVRDTVSAIRALATAGYIGRSDASTFEQHYKFLRTLEHRIQMSQMRRTHLLPQNEEAVRALARAFDVTFSAQDLLEAWNRIKLEVRALHQRIFYRPLLSAVAKLDPDAFALSSDQIQDRLRAIGFVDPKSAQQHIAALTSGLSRRADIQRQLLPVLIQWFAQGADPDSALLSFRRLSEDLGDSPWYLRMLRDSSGAAEKMTQVLANSKLATALFEKIPEAASWFERAEDLQPTSTQDLEAEIDAISSRHDDFEVAASLIRSLRRRETLRIAIGSVLGELDLSAAQKGLSDLTSAYLHGMLRLAEEAVGTGEKIAVAIVAMGRFGGEELGFGSDADVMFVYRALEDAESQNNQKLAEQVVSTLRKLVQDPVLEFDLDIDLRPEGKNGPIIRSITSYASYYERWSDSWEAQALLRARLITDDTELRVEFLALIEKYRYPSTVSEEAIIQIRRLKARMETERLPQGADPKRHMKLGRGGLSDVEWVIQLLQLRHGSQFQNLRTPNTLLALDAAVESKLVAEHDARVLSEAWVFVSRCRSAMTLWSNKPADVLPHDRKQLDGIARILGYSASSASALEQDYLAVTRRARSVFERLFYE